MMEDVELYVLTSSYTFSAAEEFTYNVKNLERGTIVGETTGGGAHPVASYVFDDLNLVIRVSFGRAINPVSGTNWEGTGVEPGHRGAGRPGARRGLSRRPDQAPRGGGEREVEYMFDWAIAGSRRSSIPLRWTSRRWSHMLVTTVPGTFV